MQKLLALTLICGLATLTLAGPADYTPISLQGNKINTATVTNGSALTIIPGVTLITSQGQANLLTNTITLAAVANAGGSYVLLNSSASTNYIAIAQSGTLVSPAIELAAGEGVNLISTATNVFYAVHP